MIFNSLFIVQTKGADGLASLSAALFPEFLLLICIQLMCGTIVTEKSRRPFFNICR